MTHTDGPEPPKAPPPPAPADMAERRPASRRLRTAVARQIDENLKLLYQSRVEEDLPPQLKELVARLRGTEGGA